MSIFGHRKPDASKKRDPLQVLQKALAALESEPEQTSRIADLKRIIAERIAELERRRNIIIR